MKFSPKKGVEFRRLGDEGILFDPESGRFFRLSSGATQCWEFLTAGRADMEMSVVAELATAGLVEVSGIGELPSRSLEREPVVMEHAAFLDCGCSSYTSKTACNKDLQHFGGCIWTGTGSTGSCHK